MAEDRCCCDICHVKTGTWIVAIVQFVFGVADLVNGIVHLVGSKEGSEETRYIVGGQVVLTAIWLLVIILLLVGLQKNKPLLILPHLIVTVIYVMLIVATTIWLAVSGEAIAKVIVALCAVLIIFGLLWVEWRCYKYISTIA